MYKKNNIAAIEGYQKEYRRIIEGILKDTLLKDRIESIVCIGLSEYELKCSRCYVTL